MMYPDEQHKQCQIEAEKEKIAELKKQIADKQQVRIMAAIAAMQGQLSNPNNLFGMCEDKVAIITKRSVRYADALVEELDKWCEL